MSAVGLVTTGDERPYRDRKRCSNDGLRATGAGLLAGSGVVDDSDVARPGVASGGRLPLGGCARGGGLLNALPTLLASLASTWQVRATGYRARQMCAWQGQHLGGAPRHWGTHQGLLRGHSELNAHTPHEHVQLCRRQTELEHRVHHRAHL